MQHSINSCSLTTSRSFRTAAEEIAKRAEPKLGLEAGAGSLTGFELAIRGEDGVGEFGAREYLGRPPSGQSQVKNVRIKRLTPI